jgi:3-deoxy-7-phosphoheptulonate synthase
MIIVMEPGASRDAVEAVEKRIRDAGLEVHVSRGVERTLVGAVGDERVFEPDMFEAMPGVERAMHIVKPYKLVSREWHPGRTDVDVDGRVIGTGDVQVIAGPCSVETDTQMAAAADAVAHAGARMMRGGAFKPRTSPYTFQGLGVEGLRMLKRAAARHGLPIVTELMDVRHLDTFLAEGVDVIQIGTRNMQNFDLLKDLGKVRRPVLLKRGLSATIEELLLSAEYILAGGNQQVILCERGIRTFENATRNTLDISAIPVVEKLSHLPMLVDPSHGTGRRDKVIPMARAGVAAGADGLLIEVHNDPEKALSDGAQSLYPEQFDRLMSELRVIAPVLGRSLPLAPVPAAGGR